MNRKLIFSLLVVVLVGGFGAYYLLESGHDHGIAAGHDHDHGHDDHDEDSPRGQHRGRLFTDGDFTVELAIFEDGVPPEFRAWFTNAGQPMDPAAVKLGVRLIRPGEVVDEHNFVAAGDFARSPAEVYEPHSFTYIVTAEHSGRTHRWELAAPEMQTTIAADAAQRAGVVAEPAGPTTLPETLAVYGQVRLNADRLARATPRFAGLVREARKSLGDSVAAGETVAIVEASESLAAFEVKAPQAGIIVARAATAGETVEAGTALYTIADLSEVWIDLSIPRGDQSRVRAGQSVTLHTDGGPDIEGTIAWISPLGSIETQTLTARVIVPNADGRWHPGLFVTADITIATVTVPVAVQEAALQTLFDFDVVFSQHGELYQARPLKLGRRHAGLVEVIAGLKAGERYVTGNSFLIKADIGKAGAAHDH